MPNQGYDGYECRTGNKQRLWMPKWRKYDDWRCGSERQTKDATLNAKRKKDMMALNAELEINNNSEHQTEDAALNAKLKKIW